MSPCMHKCLELSGTLGALSKTNSFLHHSGHKLLQNREQL